MAIFASQFADVAKLVDALDLGSSVARRGGSSPFIRTEQYDWMLGHILKFDLRGSDCSDSSKSMFSIQLTGVLRVTCCYFIDKP